ncbi:MAG TPA: patatin-like phospholipase family protein [Gemmatimonadales bacterium]|nr:patatin-like phospholipase family protein [Gemmatimonadales bacterium]
MESSPQFTLVLGGGGLKGLAHIGVLRALEERGLVPAGVVGCSMGSLIAAAWACGLPLPDVEDRALALVRKDVFRIAHLDMAVKRMLAPAIYRGEPLYELIQGVVGDVVFSDLKRRLVVNTVDLNTGQQVLWGLPGLDHAPVADAVFASCALPGILPPRVVAGRVCVDGAIVENLPVRAALTLSRNPIVAIDIGGTRVERQAVERKGFVTVYSRGLEIVMQTLASAHLRDWTIPPVILVRPQVARVSMFAFHRTPFLLAEGYRALNETLDQVPREFGKLAPGVHPQREVIVRVIRERCISCGACAARAPQIFTMGADGIAEVRSAREWWSPVGDTLLAVCPTHAIVAETAVKREQ